MKKLFTLLTMLVIGISGMWAQVVTNRESAGEPITYADYVESAGKGEKYAFQMPSTNSATYKKWCGLQSSVGNHTNLRVDQLFILEKSSTSGKYWLKRYSNNEYLSGTGDNCFSSTPLDLTLNNRLPDDRSSEYDTQNLHISFDNASGAHFNGGNGSYNFTGGPSSSNGNGGWTTYIAYGPIYIANVKCKDVSGTSLQDPVDYCVKKGTAVDAPSFNRQFVKGVKSVTVDNDQDITFTYGWPINFDKSATQSRSDRYTTHVELNDQRISFDGQKANPRKIYNDETSQQFTFARGTSVTPKIGYHGYSMYGYLYIDYNDDGDFTDEGELVSQLAANTWGWSDENKDKTIPNFTLTNTPGTYRARFKIDWNNTDPGGASTIADNGGVIVDVMIEVKNTYDVTYRVVDGSNNELASMTRKECADEVITAFPSSLIKSDFYDYSDVPETTIDGTKTITITATKKTNPLVQFSSDASSAYYYNLKIRGKYMVYNSGATGEVTLQDNSEPFTPNAAWAFIGDPYTGFKIINQANGTDKYLTYTSVIKNRHSNNNIQFVDDSQFEDQYWYFDTNSSGFVLRMKANMDIYFHHDNNNNYLRTCSTTEWSSVHNDEGSTLIFASDEEVLQNLYNDIKDVFFADGVGKYTWNGSETTAEGARANINSAGLALDNHATLYYKDLYDALLYIKDNITLNSVPAGFYRIKGNTSGKYLAAGLASNSKFNMTDATDATTIFYYDGTKLTNLSSGMCNGVTGSTWAWVVGTSASVVTFHDGHTSGGYGIQTSDAYFYDDGDNSSSSADCGANADMTNDNVRYRSWNLTEITEIPVTFKTAGLGYATFFTPVPLQIPKNNSNEYDIHAYVCQRSGNTLTFYDITNAEDEDGRIIPVNTAVLLYNSTVKSGSSDVIANFKISTKDDIVITNNSFTGWAYAKTLPTDHDVYSLRTKDSKVGFFLKTTGDCAGFKAWLETEDKTDTSSGDARTFTIRFDGEGDPTGLIEALGLENENVDIYDLNGRKLSSYKKGINIVNGKKVMVQ